MLLDVWNIKTGEGKNIKLHSDKGDVKTYPTPLYIEGDYYYGDDVSTGRLVRVNIVTGEVVYLTKELYSDSSDINNSKSGFYTHASYYSNGYIYTFYEDLIDKKYRIIVNDVKTGKEKERIELKDFYEKAMGGGKLESGFIAVNPAYIPNKSS